MADSATHDDGLSPTSKKILKECSIEMPAALSKDSRVSFVARPPSSGEHSAGFHFARPTHPRRAFTSHPQPRPTQTTEERLADTHQSRENTEAILPPDTTPQDETTIGEDVSHEDEGRTKSPERARTTSIPLEIETPRVPVSEISRPTEDTPPIPSPKHTEDVLTIHSLQPTEDDLCKLLMHKLKKREEAEAAASKLRDELKANLHDADKNNKILRAQLNELEQKYKEQQVEKTTQRQSVERWKTKFGKLRSLMAGIADHQERLLIDSRLIRREQVSLKVEKDQVHDSLNYLTESTKGIGKNISQYKAQLTGVAHQFTAEEDALNNLLRSKESQLKEVERELEETKRAVEDAKAHACKIDSEKATLESSSKEVEKRIREELSRASLMSKDQDRARYEQEKHTLTREKQQAEGDAIKAKRELETVKANLAGINAKHSDLLTTIDSHQRKLHEVEKEHQVVISSLEKAISALKEHQALQLREKADIQKQLATIQEENTAIHGENAALKQDHTDIHAKNAALEKENTDTQADNAVIMADNASLKQENIGIHIENAALKQENVAIKADIAAIQEENAALTQDNKAIHAENAAIKAEKVTVQEENAALKKENAAIEADKVAVQQENDRLKADRAAHGVESPAQLINTPSNSNDGPVKKEKQDASLKGILKETQPIATSSTKRTAQFHTPSRDAKTKRHGIPVIAPRRQSRVSSRFFDPQPTPSPSLSVITSQQDTTWTVNQSVDTFMTQSSVQSRKRRREDTFNNRFGQKYTFH
ncbi:hypothetical protein FQN49_005140 [Arthroderma sp. PD_2]|nr:hypothetical protein FQN49_005140 [Arthroderma sp. PD_2]